MRKIFISAGHDSVAQGASGNGFTEHQICTEFRNLVLQKLQALGIAAASDGTGLSNKPLREVVKLFSPKDLAVEFHLNAGPPAATGVETLSAPKDYKFGKALCETISRTLDIKNRGAKPENSGQHKTLAFVQAGGIIVELFFLSNKQDLASYLVRKEELAQEVAEVLLEYANA